MDKLQEAAINYQELINTEYTIIELNHTACCTTQYTAQVPK